MRLLAAALLVTTVVTPMTAHAAPAADGCAGEVPGLSAYTPVLGIDLPEQAHWLGQTPPYSFDRTAEVAAGFDRVGYCLELDGPNGPQWVWTAMEPFTGDAHRLGLPTTAGQLTRQRVADLEVRSNVPGVTTGTGQTGYLEIWPNQYATGASTQVANASAQLFDSDDSPTGTLGYGSFQVHQIGATRTSTQAAKTVFGIDTFTTAGPSEALSLGIGVNPDGQPDWTFANNAARFTTRKLTVYARSGLVSLTSAPQDRQLFPRDSHGGAAVAVAGRVTDPRITKVELQVSDGRRFSSRGPAFSFSPRITAGLRTYAMQLRATGPGINRTVALWDDLVSGDVYAVQGQSNAEAAKYNGAASGEESPYLRSFGSPTSDPSISAADRTWHYGVGDVTNQSGSIGQWATRLGRRLIDTYKVPVALINGAHGGQPISFFQRNDANPDDITTNYGRYRQRLVAAGALTKLRGVLFYQGESDNDNAAVHVAGYTSLLQDWRSDFGTVKYYAFQVRVSGCGNLSVNLRDAQRRMADTLGITVLSTNGLSGYDSCHYAWLNGYRELGDHTFAVLARDLYGGSPAGVAPPNPLSAAYSKADHTEITVQLRSADPLTVDPGAGPTFRVDGTTATVTEVAYQAGGKLVLTLSGPADGATGMTYLGNLRAGPWITNATGTGLLAFTGVPIA